MNDILAITLWCAAASPHHVRVVQQGSGWVHLQTPILCSTEAERIELALQHGLTTKAERGYARAGAMTFRPAQHTDARWTVDVDLSGYRAAMARL